jgi:hypothetical protein
VAVSSPPSLISPKQAAALGPASAGLFLRACHEGG